MPNGFLLPSPTQDLYFHHVSPGETLTSIIQIYYSGKTQSQIKQVLIDNPSIKNADLIKPGQLIVLRTASSNMCLAPIELNETNKVKQLWSTMNDESQKAIKVTAPMYNGLTLGLAGGGIGLFSLEKTLKSNMSFLSGIPDAYHQYKSGNISKYEFDKIRRLKLKQYTNNIGPMFDKVIYGDNKIKNTFKLKPGRSLNATKSMTQHLGKLKTISNAASKGGVILAGVGLAASCYQVAQAEIFTEKNEIAVETITSTGVGVVVGTIASIMLIGTPVGWGIVLIVGATSAGASWAAGKFSGSIYKSHFSDVNIVNSLGINKICN